MENNEWKVWEHELEEDSYYELAFLKDGYSYNDSKTDENIKVEPAFIHQGILKYNKGFKENTYWLRPNPTHIRKIKLSLPVLVNES